MYFWIFDHIISKKRFLTISEQSFVSKSYTTLEYKIFFYEENENISYLYSWIKLIDIHQINDIKLC